LKTRSRAEIIGLILQAVEAEPLTRYKIMYQVILSFKQATDYTSLMIQQELLSYSKLDRKYIITDKGREFLALYNETDRLLTPPIHNDDEDDDYLVSGKLQMQEQYAEVTII
jgi:predicted transcriptional regulator